MSYFIANSLTVSKDFKTFKVKGGDNNCFPRSNNWSEWIDITTLLDMLSSGSLQFGNTNKEKFLMLESLSVKYKAEYGGDWDKETDMYHMFHASVLDTRLGNVNKAFIKELKIELKQVNKKPFRVTMSSGYHGCEYVYSLKKINGTSHAHMTSNKESAKAFGKYQANRIIKRYSNHKAKMEEI